jgi:CubicO group peptidase (beta-lactamase class C family)
LAVAVAAKHPVSGQTVPRYGYARPPALADGIAVGTLGAVQLDSALIVAGTDAILAGTYPGIRSLLIVRHNRLVYENYFFADDRGAGAESHPREFLQDLRSVTKTVVGAAVLVAHAQGKIGSLDQPIFDFFPEYAAYAVDGREDITIRHLLSMTAGLEWDEDISYLDPANTESQMQRAPDAIEFVLTRRLLTAPGSKFAYCGGCSHLLAEIVRRATGQPVDAFVSKHLFSPLGIARFDWARADDGLPYGFSGLRLRSRDLAKIGLLLKNRGEWAGEQVIPRDLVADALAEHVVVAPEDAAGDVLAYGYQVWRFSFTENGRRVQLVQMSGNGGQAVYLSDSLDMIVVITAGNFDRAVAKSSLDFYLDHIVPAVRDPR